jgi:hypothetical protein
MAPYPFSVRHRTVSRWVNEIEEKLLLSNELRGSGKLGEVQE